MSPILIVAVLVIVVVLVAVAVAITLTVRSGQGSSSAPPAGPGGSPTWGPQGQVPMAPVAPSAETEQLRRERERLVRALVDVGDQLESAALRSWITQALGEVGVAEVVVDGQRFDPSVHHALEQVATNDPAYDHVVARTARAGYVDRGRVVRAPQVLVYRYGAS